MKDTTFAEVTERLQELVNATTIEKSKGHQLADLRGLFKGEWRRNITDAISLFAKNSTFSCIRLNAGAEQFTAEQIARMHPTRLYPLMESHCKLPLVFLYATSGKANCASVAVKVYSLFDTHLGPSLELLDKADFKDPKLEAAARQLVKYVDVYKTTLGIKALAAKAGK
jgi:hypothetical protein